MDYDGFVEFVQSHFTDGLVLVVGSGLSAAEGLSGMGALAAHLSDRSDRLDGKDALLWGRIKEVLDDDGGLEAALLKHKPTPELERWIVEETCACLLPEERKVMAAAISGKQTLRLTMFLRKILKPQAGLPILTTNYDRLVEVACELAGLHVDTTAVGHYAASFDHQQSCMGSCRGMKKSGKYQVLDHFPRAIVLKPHGSFDWYQSANGPRRCSYDLPEPRMVITPGVNKYRQGYNAPFDKHRDLANDHIKQKSRLLIVGYGFNDDHLQTHLLNKIKGGAPTLIMNRTVTQKILDLTKESDYCVCVSQCSNCSGTAVQVGEKRFQKDDLDLWDLGVLTKELLT